jgi:hypothetical protein
MPKGATTSGHVLEVAKVDRPSAAINWPDGGRTWWAHFEFARINIQPIILKNKIEELREPGRLRTFHVGHRATQTLCADHAWMPSGSSRRRDASAPSCWRHPVHAREHARHVALVAESGSVRCLCK